MDKRKLLIFLGVHPLNGKVSKARSVSVKEKSVNSD